MCLTCNENLDDPNIQCVPYLTVRNSTEFRSRESKSIIELMDDQNYVFVLRESVMNSEILIVKLFSFFGN